MTGWVYWKGMSKDIKRAWADISMDFIDELQILKGKDTIWVVVYRLTKYGHFVALAPSYSALTVAQAYLDNIFKLHGLPDTIVSDRDKVFVSNFCQDWGSRLLPPIAPGLDIGKEGKSDNDLGVDRMANSFPKDASWENLVDL
ncbi:reverse transcriptase [Gossypium australe]|uniref:Reverse transcriptase n=1 Tax=Gossypium australe TaxID=47621 RepID=A0A5B6VMK5_9ROSI|nr:reverse transcriptase [Gossypium australe]